MTFERVRPLIAPASYVAAGVPAVYDAVSASDLASLRAMVADMHARATVPMLPDIREPSELRIGSRG